jgi:hypothetical protein
MLRSFLLLSACLSLQAASVTVSAGGNLQSALNQAKGGDTITLAAGATFTGHFSVPANSSGQTITIQSSGIGNLPAGERVSPSQAKSMARIQTPDANTVFVLPAGANNYVIQGIEFLAGNGVYGEDLISCGTSHETSASQLPQNITFDRDYIHADPNTGAHRGIALNSGKATVANSYFSDFISDWQDTQAIAGWNGTGPYLIQNNFLQAGSENVAFGGAIPAINGLIPSDITIQNNDFFKPTSWYADSSDYAGFRVWAKNHLELKNAKNVVIQNNNFVNNFIQADQIGCSLIFSVRDEDGRVPWATVSNVSVKNNHFANIAGGILFMGHDGDGGGTAGQFTVSGNLYEALGWGGGDGRLYEILNGVQGVTIDHETGFANGWLLVFAQGPSNNVNVTNSIFFNGGGVAGEGTSPGNATLNYYSPNSTFKNNVVIGGNASQYSGGHFGVNFFPSSATQVGFVDFDHGNFLLTATSPYAGIGASIGPFGSSPAPVPTPTPTPTPTSEIPTGWVEIINWNSGKCLDVPGSSLNLATGIIQYACSGAMNQKWQFVSVSGGYKIVNQNSGQGLDINGESPNAGALLIQWPYEGAQNEIFTVTPQGDGSFTISPNHSGQMLDVPGSSLKNGAGIIQWPSNGGNNQKWMLKP